MDKKLANIGKYLLWTAVAAVLLYFSFRGVNWKDFGAALRGCHWGYVIVSMALGAAVFYIRALRWRMQLLPLDPSTSRLTCWNAYNICMLTNIVLPRVGEVVRCGVVTRHSARDAEGKRLVSFDKAIGTVVVDRLWDGVSVLVVLLLILTLLWGRFGSFFTGTLFPGLSGKAHLWWILFLGALLAGGFISFAGGCASGKASGAASGDGSRVSTTACFPACTCGMAGCSSFIRPSSGYCTG
jgi:Uncharacterised protein family (UPF0104).